MVPNESCNHNEKTFFCFFNTAFLDTSKVIVPNRHGGLD